MTKVGAFGVVLGLAAGIATFWGACKSPTIATDGILLTGQWGSDQGRFTATQVSTQFNGACGAGNTNEPIMLDKHGHFDIVGVYGAAGGAMTSARFSGAVSSKKLTLIVMRADSSRVVGPLMMDLGQQPTLATCR